MARHYSVQTRFAGTAGSHRGVRRHHGSLPDECRPIFCRAFPDETFHFLHPPSKNFLPQHPLLFTTHPLPPAYLKISVRLATLTHHHLLSSRRKPSIASSVFGLPSASSLPELGSSKSHPPSDPEREKIFSPLIPPPHFPALVCSSASPPPGTNNTTPKLDTQQGVVYVSARSELRLPTLSPHQAASISHIAKTL